MSCRIPEDYCRVSPAHQWSRLFETRTLVQSLIVGTFLARRMWLQGRGSASRRDAATTSQRSGFTLIEVVTVIGMIALVMTSVAVTISSLHQLNTKLRDEFPTSAAVAGLGLQLRSDAHAARQASLAIGDQGESVLRLMLTDQRLVEYSAKQARATRRVRLGDQIERNEVFVLPRGSELNWSIGDGTPLVTLTIRRHVGKSPAATDDVRETRISTAVGLDHRTN